MTAGVDRAIPITAKVTLSYDLGDAVPGAEVVHVQHDLVPFVGNVDDLSDHGLRILQLLEREGFLVNEQ